MVFYDDWEPEVGVILKFFTLTNTTVNKSQEDQYKKNTDQRLGIQDKKQSNKDRHQDSHERV